MMIATSILTKGIFLLLYVLQLLHEVLLLSLKLHRAVAAESPDGLQVRTRRLGVTVKVIISGG